MLWITGNSPIIVVDSTDIVVTPQSMEQERIPHACYFSIHGPTRCVWQTNRTSAWSYVGVGNCREHDLVENELKLLTAAHELAPELELGRGAEIGVAAWQAQRVARIASFHDKETRLVGTRAFVDSRNALDPARMWKRLGRFLDPSERRVAARAKLARCPQRGPVCLLFAANGDLIGTANRKCAQPEEALAEVLGNTPDVDLGALTPAHIEPESSSCVLL